MSIIHRRAAWRSSAFAVFAVLAGCADDPAAPDGETPVDPAAAAVEITQANHPQLGATVQFGAVVRDAAGEPLADRSIAWSSSDTLAMRVDSAGRVTGLRAGQVATITARYGALQDTVMPRVGTGYTPFPAESLKIVQDSVVVPAGSQAWLAVDRWDRYGNLLNEELPEPWTIDDPTVATVDEGGRVLARGSGRTTARIAAGGRRDSVVVRVRQVAVVSASQGINHACGLIASGEALCWGDNTFGQLGAATGRRGVLRQGAQAFLSHATATPVFAQIGLRFRFIAAGRRVTCGISTVGALFCWGEGELLGVPDRQPVNDALPGGAGCWWDPPGIAIQPGYRDFGCSFRPVEPLPGRTFTLVRMESDRVCATTADGEGWCWTDGTAPARAPALAPLASVRVEPDTLRLPFGEFGHLRATAVDSAGRTVTGALAAWRSSDSTVASIGPYGHVAAHRAGRTRIEAEIEGRVGSALVIVDEPALDSVVAWPDTLLVARGESRTLTVELVFSNRTSVPGQPAVWRSLDPATATVDAQTGRVTGRAGGRARIVGTHRHLADTAVVHVVEYDEPLAFATIDAGRTHACGITTEGALFCWGSDDGGALGADGPREVCGIRRMPAAGGRWTSAVAPCAPLPLPVRPGMRFQSVAVGSGATCAISDGRTFCWGPAGKVWLGTGTVEGEVVRGPTPVAGGHRFQTIHLREHHVCALTPGGEAYCWGSNDHGQAGIGTATPHPLTEPRAVAGDLRFDSISVGFAHSCGVTTSGEAYCWGRNVAGELGIGPDIEDCDGLDCVTRPTRVASDVRFRSIHAAVFSTCAVSHEGAGYCWGTNDSPQRVPTRVEDGTTFRSIAAGPVARCGVTAADRLACWLRRGEPIPGMLSTDLRIRSHSQGSGFLCAMGGDNRVYCWGRGEWGQLGSGAPGASGVPRPIIGQR